MTPTTESPATTSTPRPASPKRLAANRRNARHSTGPKTQEGKKVTRLNACRHFLTAQVSILPPAEREVVEAFCAPLVANLAPGSDFERQLARAIAEAQWRLNRARAMEETFFAAEIAYAVPEQAAGGHHQVEDAFSQARAFSNDPRAFDRLAIYEQRIRRGMANDLKMFNEMKAARLAAEAKALEEAIQLRRHAVAAKSEEEANNGSVWTNEFLDAKIHRQDRLSSPAPRPSHPLKKAA